MNDTVHKLAGRFNHPRVAVVCALALGLAFGTFLTSGLRARAASPQHPVLSIPAPVQLSSPFADIATQLRPSVVNINTETTVKQSVRGQRGQNPFDDQDNPFQQFFGVNPFGNAPRTPMHEKFLGSGVVVDHEGDILTNQHVVKNADRIQVKFSDDPKMYTAKLVGSDDETDLAVVRVEGKSNLVPAKLGNSDGMRVGDQVLAFGSPFTLEESVTSGIISAKNRDVGGQFQHFLQTDAAINHGNSGGPLVNMAGQVIGINTMILSQGGDWAGVGFALPSNTAIQVFNDISKTGHVSRGSIGVQFHNDPSQNAALLHAFGVKQGVLVDSVVDDSPAAKAGLKSGDVITAVNGTAVKDGNELVDKISSTAPGTPVRIQYFRDGKQAEAMVTVADRAKMYADNGSDESAGGSSTDNSGAKFGLELQALTPDLAQRLNAHTNHGLVVAQVEPGSFADDLGMARGDVIIEIQHQPVRTIDDVRRVQHTLKVGQDVLFKIERQGRSLFLAGTLK